MIAFSFAGFWDFIVRIRSAIKDALSELLSQGSVLIYLGLLVLMNAAQWFYAAALVSRAGGEMAMHYNVDFGFDAYRSAWYLYFFPLVSLAFVFLNTAVFSFLVRHKDRIFIGHMLFAPLLLLNVLLFAFLFNISLVNSL
jgi:hypothetical protein